MSSSQYSSEKLAAPPASSLAKSKSHSSLKELVTSISDDKIKQGGETLLLLTDNRVVKIVSIDPLFELHQTLRGEVQHGQLDLELMLNDPDVKSSIKNAGFYFRGKNKNKGTFLLSALEGATTGRIKFDLLEKILEMAPQQIDAALDFTSQNALDYAVFYTANESLQLKLVDLLFQHKADPSKKDGMGKSAFIYAVQNAACSRDPSLKVIEKFVENKLVNEQISKEDALLALHTASTSPPCIPLVLKCKSLKDNPLLVNEKINGTTALKKAAENKEAVLALLKAPHLILDFTFKGADEKYHTVDALVEQKNSDYAKGPHWNPSKHKSCIDSIRIIKLASLSQMSS